MTVTFTDPRILDAIRRGEPWVDPELDPTRIDWPARQATAAIPFQVVGGRPVNPCAQTGIRYGRNELPHWGEQLCADAFVRAGDYLLMVERGDGHGWALPGGRVDPGETALEGGVRELAEETGLVLPSHMFTPGRPRYVPDPRASDEAWMVTVVCHASIGQRMPVVGMDDARRAAWIPASSYQQLVDHLEAVFGGVVFPSHVEILKESL